MLKEILEAKREKLRVFQVLLLHNDASEEVEILEAEEVDFPRIQDHLKEGGSVFVTSKNSQKLPMPTEQEARHQKKNRVRTLTTFYFDQF